MLFSRYIPPAPWDRYIQYFWVLEGDYTFYNLSKERFLPDGHFEIIIDLADPLLQTDLNDQFIKRPKSFIGGLYKRHFYVKPTGRVHSIGVLFKPGSFQKFTNFPQSDFNGIATLQDCYGESAIILEERINEKKSNKEKIKDLSEFVFSQLSEKDLVPPFIQDSMDIILHKKGVIKIDDISKVFNVTPRHLRRVFRAHYGYGIKEFTKIIRIDNLLKFWHENKNIPLSDILYRFDYYDYSHFARDFKITCGISPKKYFKEKHPIDDRFFEWTSASSYEIFS